MKKKMKWVFVAYTSIGISCGITLAGIGVNPLFRVVVFVMGISIFSIVAFIFLQDFIEFTEKYDDETTKVDN